MGHKELQRRRATVAAPHDPADPRLAESDHRIANSLNLTVAMLRMQRQQSADGAVQSAILSAETRINSIARFHAYLHRRILDERVNLADLFREVLPEMGAAVGVHCLLAVNASRPLDVSKRVARQLMLIINELALNARKHGYAGREGGCISVELDFDAGNHLVIRLADGGTGLPDGFDPMGGDGLGLRIVSAMVDEMGGALSSYTDSGAHFTITVPVG